MIVNDPQHIGRSLDDHRLIPHLEPGKHVDTGGVRGQEQRLGIHQVFEEHGRRIGRPELQKSFPNGIHGGNLGPVHVGLERVLEVQEVVSLLDGLVVGHAVEEVQVAKAGLDIVGRNDPRWNLGGHLHLGRLSAAVLRPRDSVSSAANTSATIVRYQFLLIVVSPVSKEVM